MLSCREPWKRRGTYFGVVDWLMENDEERRLNRRKMGSGIS